MKRRGQEQPVLNDISDRKIYDGVSEQSDELDDTVTAKIMLPDFNRDRLASGIYKQNALLSSRRYGRAQKWGASLQKVVRKRTRGTKLKTQRRR